MGGDVSAGGEEVGGDAGNANRGWNWCGCMSGRAACSHCCGITRDGKGQAWAEVYRLVVGALSGDRGRCAFQNWRGDISRWVARSRCGGTIRRWMGSGGRGRGFVGRWSKNQTMLAYYR